MRSADPSPAPLGRLAEVFLRVGNTTFGGAYVAVGMLGRELVDVRRWLTAQQFDLAFALARVTPGANMIAFCAAAGAMLRGVSGAVAAALAVTAPSAILAVLIMRGIESWQTNPIAAAAIGGAVAAVAGMMWATIWTIVRPHIGGLARTLQALVIAGGAFVASWAFGVAPVPILGVAVLVGLFWEEASRQ